MHVIQKENNVLTSAFDLKRRGMIQTYKAGTSGSINVFRNRGSPNFTICLL